MQHASPAHYPAGDAPQGVTPAALRVAGIAIAATLLVVWFLAPTDPAEPTGTPAVELRPVVGPSLSVMSIDRLLQPPQASALLSPESLLGPDEADTPSTAAEQLNLARFIAQKYRLSITDTRRYVHYAFMVANEHSLDPMLILAVMSVESSFNPRARSAKGAKGLMQVLARVHAEKFEPYGGIARVYDPLVNIRVGARILREYIEREGSVRAALKSYVGAALLSHDYGYGRKVLRERARLEAVATGGLQTARHALGPVQAANLDAPGRTVAESGVEAPSVPIAAPGGNGELPVNHGHDAAAVDPLSPDHKADSAQL